MDITQDTKMHPDMVALIRMRFWIHLRASMDCWRCDEPNRAWHHLGVAKGQMLALYDTSVDAYKYGKAVDKMERIYGK